MTLRSLIRTIFAALLPGGSAGGGGSDADGSFREISVVNYPTTKTESLERTLDRAESVLEAQLTDLADADEKAVRTVRIEVILLGAIASIGRLSSSPLPVNGWLKAGGVLLVTSIVVGMFTYSSSSPDYGPGPDYVRPNIESGSANEEVYLELLEGYSRAISHNQRTLTRSAVYLFFTQVLLVASLVSGTVGGLV